MGALTLFRRGITGGADGALFHSQSHFAGLVIAFALGDAEVHEFVYTIAVEHDIGRLYIAVYHAGFGQTIQRIGHGNQHDFQLIFGQTLFSGKLQQRFAFHILHGNKEIAGLEVAAHVKNFDDIGVVELMRKFGFAQKTLYIDRIIGFHAAAHKFQRAFLFKQQVFCQINFRHAAFAQQSDDLVFIKDFAILKHAPELLSAIAVRGQGRGIGIFQISGIAVDGGTAFRAGDIRIIDYIQRHFEFGAALRTKCQCRKIAVSIADLT